METYSIEGQNISEPQWAHQIQQLDADFENRHLLRQQKLKTIKLHLNEHKHGHVRHKQNIILYFINLALPITLSYLNAYVLLDLGINSELKGRLIITFVVFGFFVSLYTSLMVAPWRQVGRLFFHIDSIVPGIIAATISFFSVFNYLSTSQYYQKGMAVCFPVWVIYYAGSLRVMIAYLDWARWEVLLYKTVVLSCALIFFYVGFTYMNGAYKITEGYLVSVEDTVKNMVYLYVFGIVELFFTYFRMLSDFDQTKDLKFEYQFQDQQAHRSKAIAKIQFQELERQVIEQDIQDAISVKQIKTFRLITRKITEAIRQSL